MTKKQLPGYDPRQQHLVDPETNERIGEPYRNDRIDQKYMERSRVRMKLEQLTERESELTKELKELLIEDAEAIKTMSGPEARYTTVDSSGKLRDIAIVFPEPRLIDTKSRLKVDLDE